LVDGGIVHGEDDEVQGSSLAWNSDMIEAVLQHQGQIFLAFLHIGAGTLSLLFNRTFILSDFFTHGLKR
jgi:hypothetical protein